MSELLRTTTRFRGPYNGEHSDTANLQVNVGLLERLLCTIGGGALALYGLKRLSKIHIGLALGGAALVYRGLTGYCPAYKAAGIDTTRQAEGVGLQGIQINRTVTINKSPEEVYRFWRNLENLPRFMQHLASVQITGERRSHWVVTAPMGISLEWDAEITAERPHTLLAWRSLPGADVVNEGVVQFHPAAGGRGTEVQVSLAYRPPGGVAGAAFARLFNATTAQQIQEDLRRFKQVMEAGEIATSTGQPAGSRT
jgi:uncharacterized membrane protein